MEGKKEKVSRVGVFPRKSPSDFSVTNFPDIFQYSWRASHFVYDVCYSCDVSDECPLFSAVPNRPCQSLIIPTDYIDLVNKKDGIGIYEIKKIWSKYSHGLNPYERIVNMSSRKISRAYFKLYEILCYFNILKGNGEIPIRSLHLCEAPGGFVQACLDFFNKNVDWHAQTLYTETDIKIDPSLDVNRWVYNGDGNMYKLTNMIELYNKVGRVNLVTGDGGFDVSCNHNNQEQMSLRLIFCEFVMSLIVLEKGGCFVCKMFDSFTKPTVQMLCIMKKYFGRVSLIKPRSSRYMNGEKFVVCMDFLGIEFGELEYFKNTVDIWKDNEYCNDFNVSIRVIQKDILKYNSFLSRHQSWYIDKAIQLCKIESLQYLKALQVPQNKKANLYCMTFGMIEKKNCSHKKKTAIQESVRDTAFSGASKARDTVSNRADSVRDTEEAGESGFGSANVSVAGIYRCEECIEEFIIV